MICGTTISDGIKTYRLVASVSYGATTLNVPRYVYSPLSGAYPIIDINSNLNYRQGSLSAVMVGTDFDSTNKINREDSTKQAKDLCDFLLNDNLKTIRDKNGNIIIARFTSANMSYNANYGNGIVTVNANWIEQGEQTENAEEV